ncbi:MAG: hypothetical protein NUV91_06130 [Candidatus Omnitrophica bacterium]|nr:hypothetical protein [Candidatus Omnitrophota bacterium]
MKISQKAQSVVEYTTIAVLVIVGILVMGPYVLRSINAHFKMLDEGVQDSFEENIKPSSDRFPGLPLCDCSTREFCGDGPGTGCPRYFQGTETKCSVPGCADCDASCTPQTLGQAGCQNCCLVNECQKSLPASMQRPPLECHESKCCCDFFPQIPASCQDGRGTDYNGDGVVDASEDLMECCGINSGNEIESLIPAGEQIGCEESGRGDIYRRPVRAYGQVGCEDGELFEYERCGEGVVKPKCSASPSCEFHCEGALNENAHWCEANQQAREGGLPSNVEITYVTSNVQCDEDVRCQAQCDQGYTYLEGQGCQKLRYCTWGGAYEEYVFSAGNENGGIPPDNNPNPAACTTGNCPRWDGRPQTKVRTPNPVTGGGNCPQGFNVGRHATGGYSPVDSQWWVWAGSWTKIFSCLQCFPDNTALPEGWEPQDVFGGFFVFGLKGKNNDFLDPVNNPDDNPANNPERNCIQSNPLTGGCTCPEGVVKSYPVWVGTTRPGDDPGGDTYDIEFEPASDRGGTDADATWHWEISDHVVVFCMYHNPRSQ